MITFSKNFSKYKAKKKGIPMVIKKGGGWAGSNSWTGNTREAELHRKIEDGTINDQELNEVVKTGGELDKHLTKRANELKPIKEHNERIYGLKFDGVTKKGEPFREHQLDMGH